MKTEIKNALESLSNNEIIEAIAILKNRKAEYVNQKCDELNALLKELHENNIDVICDGMLFSGCEKANHDTAIQLYCDYYDEYEYDD